MAKIRFTFKTPDVSDQLDLNELKDAVPVLKKFIKYGETITVEFDTETKEAIVIPL